MATAIDLSPTLTEARDSDTATPIPLQRVRLYETGVGYFERRGRVRGNVATLPLPAAHLDDAIKSLMILDGDAGARVAGVSFPSAVGQGMARAMAGLPPSEDGEPIDHRTLLRSLVGLNVEGRTTSGPVRGQVIEVLGPFERPRPPKDEESASPGPAHPAYAVLLVTETGAVRRIPTDDLVELGPRDAAQARRIHAAATALSGSAARRTESLRVELARGGQIAVGYVAETPVWRTSYRVVLPTEGERATLQAWALVHNDTDEDWNDVRLEFVNGEPSSFLFPLAAPRYERRELRAPDRPLSTVPQLARHTVDAMYGDLDADPYGEGSIGLGGVGHGGGSGAGFGGRGRRVSRAAHTQAGMTEADDDTWGHLAQYSQASTEPAGALFTYRLADPVDLPAQSSALVPLVQAGIQAQSITFVSPDETTGRTAARVVNDTVQTLPAGTIGFFHRGGFAGEAELPRLKPSERAFVTYGRDLDVEVSRTRSGRSSHVVGVVQAGDHIGITEEIEFDLTVAVENRDATPRKVYAGLPVPARSDVTGAPELDFDDARGQALCVVMVPARETSTHRLRVAHGKRTRRPIEDLSAEELRRLSLAQRLPADTREILEQAREQRTTLERDQARAGKLKGRIEQAKEDLKRLRESVASMSHQNAANRAARHLAARILETERRIGSDRSTLEGLETRREKLQARIQATLAQLAPP